MNWELIIQIAGTLIGLTTAFFGVITYCKEKWTEKRNRTIEKVGELIEEYHKQFDETGVNTDYKKDIRFLSLVEQFCIAVESEVYCKETVRKYGSKFLSNLYEKYKDTVIAKRRKNYVYKDIIADNEVSYYYLGKLVKSFNQQVTHA